MDAPIPRPPVPASPRVATVTGSVPRYGTPAGSVPAPGDPDIGELGIGALGRLSETTTDGAVA